MFKKLTLVSLVVLFCNCTNHFLLYQTGSGNLSAHGTSSKPSIGVVVRDEFNSSSDNAYSKLMAAALIRRGFIVKTVSSTELLPKDFYDNLKTDPQKKQSAISNILSSIGGTAKFKGDKSAWEELFGLNDIKDTKVRATDLIDLENILLKNWSVNYIVQIVPSKGAEFEFSISVVRVVDRAIVFTLYVSADAASIDIEGNKIEGLEVSEEAKMTSTIRLIHLFDKISNNLHPLP
jgi:hypothetical protein